MAHAFVDADASSGALEADVWVVRGRIFEIVFSRPVPRVSDHVRVRELVLFLGNADNFTASVNAGDSGDVMARTGPAARELPLATMRLAIDEPTGAAILQRRCSIEADGWNIYKLEDFSQVCTDEANYIVVAERTDMSQIIAFKQHDTEARFHLIDVSGDAILRLPLCLRYAGIGKGGS